MTNQNFSNDSSQCLFIGNRKLDEVIAQDIGELAQIGGCFQAIGARMGHLVNQIKNVYETERMKKRADIFRKYGYNTTEIFDVPGHDEDPSTPRGKVMRDIYTLFNAQGLVPGETKIGVGTIFHTRGIQVCPFEDCSAPGSTSNSDYTVLDLRTGRELVINELTSHLAGAHHLLEKDNQYGISAREFYERFM